ncbi:MAG TPA: CvpA family protein [Phycisphaerae bacterium]|nr:CvpA family protein [Phycisphaerae bacterium]
MLIQILATLLVLGIAFFQGVQGIFSSLITAVLTVLSAAVALEFYEPLGAALYATQPATAEAISLIALFVVPLLAMRALTDWAVRGNVVLGSDIISVWAGRVVGGVLGMVTGLILVGVLTIAIQMLPLGPSIMGFKPFDGSLAREQGIAPFYPDEFVLGMFQKFSVGPLSGRHDYYETHDDVLLEAFCARNTVGWNGRVEAPPGSIKVAGVADFDVNTFEPRITRDDHPILFDPDAPGGKLIRVSVHVDASARDQDGRWRLPGTHFRLVGKKGKSYYPLAGAVTDILDNQGKAIQTIVVLRRDAKSVPIPRDLLARFTQSAKPLAGKQGRWDRTRLALYAQSPPARDLASVARETGKPDVRPKTLVVDWIYRIDESETPHHMVFRRIARSEVPQ